jgi:hypothetical protein
MHSIQVPEQGSVISVEIENAFARGQIPPGPKTTLFTGTVLPSFKWLTDREFCITGDEQMSVRVINMKAVRALTMISGQTRTVNTQDQVFTVKGSKGDTYVVTKNSKGWTCTCKGFEFRKSCKHIAEMGKQTQTK